MYMTWEQEEYQIFRAILTCSEQGTIKFIQRPGTYPVALFKQ